MSNSIADAVDNIAEEFPGGGSGSSRSITEALDRIRKVVAGCCSGSIDYSHLAIGPVEHILVFGSVDTIALKDVGVEGKVPYFSSHGVLTDLCGRTLPGTVCQSALPVDLSIFPGTGLWPTVQAGPPFDTLPVDNTNTVVPVIAPSVGYAKCFTDFGKGDTIVTVGPSIPKIAVTKDGGAQFWVSLCMAISQGTGKYAGAKGEHAFVGSAYFPEWPKDPKKVPPLLAAGFKVKLVRCIKAVLKADLA